MKLHSNSMGFFSKVWNRKYRTASIVLPGPDRVGDAFVVRTLYDGEYTAIWSPINNTVRWVQPNDSEDEIKEVSSWREAQ